MAAKIIYLRIAGLMMMTILNQENIVVHVEEEISLQVHFEDENFVIRFPPFNNERFKVVKPLLINSIL